MAVRRALSGGLPLVEDPRHSLLRIRSADLEGWRSTFTSDIPTANGEHSSSLATIVRHGGWRLVTSTASGHNQARWIDKLG